MEANKRSTGPTEVNRTVSGGIHNSDGPQINQTNINEFHYNNYSASEARTIQRLERQLSIEAGSLAQALADPSIFWDEDSNAQEDHNHSIIPRESWKVDVAKLLKWPTLLARISTYDQKKFQRRLRLKRIPGTGKWLLNHGSMQEWMDDPQISSIWLCGHIGSGKTFLCSALIDHLEKQSITTGTPVFYFFCDVLKSKNTKEMIESLNKQLLIYLTKIHKKLPKKVTSKIQYFYTPSGPEPDLEDTFDIFSNLLAFINQAWFIIDGLDELDINGLQETVFQLQKLFPARSMHKLLVASREQICPNTRILLQQTICISRADTELEVLQYIKFEISRKMEQELVLTESENVIETIKNRLAAESQGMFLWVRLQLEALWLDCFSDDDILNSLDNLPPDLPATYRRCLQRIPTSSIPIAKKVFRWVICATRPLQIRELQEVIGFELTDRQWSREKLVNGARISSSCSNLIALDDTNAVNFIHASVKQYLCGDHGDFPPMFSTFNEGEEALTCGKECLNYLNFSQKVSGHTIPALLPPPAGIVSSLFGSKFTSRISKMVSLRSHPSETKSSQLRLESLPFESVDARKYAFLDYARYNWAIHTKNITTKSLFWNVFSALALTPNTNWKLHPWNVYHQSMGSHIHGLLAYASRIGHLPLLSVIIGQHGGNGGLLEKICDIPSVEDGLPPLHAAARSGNLETTKLLLKVCDLHAVDAENKTALYHAQMKGRLDVVRLLVEEEKALRQGYDAWVKNQKYYVGSREPEAHFEMNGAFDCDSFWV